MPSEKSTRVSADTDYFSINLSKVICLNQSVVEKKKTGELLAAKVVSIDRLNISWGFSLNMPLGESSQAPETHHALLGEQAHSQAQRQK